MNAPLLINVHPKPNERGISSSLVGKRGQRGTFVCLKVFGISLYLDAAESEHNMRMSVSEFRRRINQAIDDALTEEDE